MLLQTESSGHSISPGRFDQYIYPYYKADLDAGKITRESAQELLDCIWVKLNDLNKVRDKDSAEGFAGYSLFQNLIAGGQDAEGNDVTNDLSFMCIEASMHVRLPAPSLSVRVWNGTPNEFLIKAAKLTRTGVGLPAYYNDEVIIPALMSRGLTVEDARTYNIIGCVEPQKAGKTDGLARRRLLQYVPPARARLHGRPGERRAGRRGDEADLRDALLRRVLRRLPAADGLLHQPAGQRGQRHRPRPRRTLPAALPVLHDRRLHRARQIAPGGRRGLQLHRAAGASASRTSPIRCSR